VAFSEISILRIHSHFERQVSIGGPLHPGPLIETNIGKVKKIFQSEVEVAGFRSGETIDDDLLVLHHSRFNEEFIEILLLLPNAYLVPL
jgi:hypothetical protein